MKKKNKKSSYIFLSVITTGIFVLIGTALLINSNKSRVITLDYNENDRITYKVLLNNNEYMDEDLEYNTNEIDDIEIKYYYDIEFSEDLDTTLNNYVYSTIKVVDENNTVIYKKEEDPEKKKRFKDEDNELTPEEQSEKFMDTLFNKVAKGLDWDDKIKVKDIKEWIPPEKTKEAYNEMLYSLAEEMGYL